MLMTIMMTFNLLCLLALTGMLARLMRPTPQAASTESFARVLEAAAPTVQCLIDQSGALQDTDPPRGETAKPEEICAGRTSPEAPPGEARVVTEPSLADRLAIIRHMLQGKSVEETAAAAGLACETVRAIYRLHGREGAKKC